MRRATTPLLLCGLLSLAPLAAHARTVRTLEAEHAVARGETVRVELAVAELRVVGHDSDRLEISVDVSCSRSSRRCLDSAEDLEIQVHESARGVKVELGGLPKWGRGGMDLEILLRMPTTSPLALDIGVGEVEIEGLAADLEVEIGVGEVTVMMPRDAVGEIEIDTGVGQGSIEVEGESVAARRFFLGDEVRWADGAGSARVSIDVGVGEAVVELD